MERGLDVLCKRIEFFFVHDACSANFAHHGALVTNGLDDIASACLTLCPDERGALGDAPQCLAQVTGATNKGNFETVLVNVVFFVCGGENFGFVDVVDTYRLKYLGRGV